MKLLPLFQKLPKRLAFVKTKALAAKKTIMAFLAVFFFGTGVAISPPSNAYVLPVIDMPDWMINTMSWIEDMLIEVEAVVQTAEQITMVEEQIKQVEMMITNLVKGPMQMWARINSLIDRFNNLSLRLRRLTDKDYYLSQLKVLDFYKNNGCFAVGKQCTQKDLEAWRDYVLQQSKSYEEAMKALVEVSEEQKESLMTDEQLALKQLIQDANKAEGAQQTMDAGNALLGKLNQQMMSLRAAQLSTIDMAIEKARAEHEAKVKQEAVIQKFHGEPFHFERVQRKGWSVVN
jgi:P-type conjugative transfer protein TrbJ